MKRFPSRKNKVRTRSSPRKTDERMRVAQRSLTNWAPSFSLGFA
jgi:hypothetical protein